MPGPWNYLVYETRFASELVESGIRRLCTVPIREDYGWPVSHDQMFPLHVGLHAYVTGLERLCKLTIVCHGYLTTGAFTSVKPFGHKIGSLMDAVEGIDLSVVAIDGIGAPSHPQDDLDPTLTQVLERFANGAGRYEHLDALWNDQKDVATLTTWTELCGRVAPSEHVRNLISLRNTVVDRMRRLSTYGHLEGASYSLIESLDPYLSELSSEVALRLYEKARWVAATLDALTYYTSQELPLLGEAVLHIKQPTEEFFQYSVAQIGDKEAAVEDLESHLENFGQLLEDEE